MIFVWCTFLKPEKRMWLLCSDKFFTFFLIKGIIAYQELLKNEFEANAVHHDVLIKCMKMYVTLE